MTEDDAAESMATPDADATASSTDGDATASVPLVAAASAVVVIIDVEDTSAALAVDVVIEEAVDCRVWPVVSTDELIEVAPDNDDDADIEVETLEVVVVAVLTLDITVEFVEESTSAADEFDNVVEAIVNDVVGSRVKKGSTF